MGVVFQAYRRFRHPSDRDNVTLAPVRGHRVPKDEARHRAMTVLERVGLGGRGTARPDELSGGQQRGHEMASARQVADTVCLLHDGVIHEQGPPAQVLGDPREDRTRQLLSRISA